MEKTLKIECIIEGTRPLLQNRLDPKDLFVKVRQPQSYEEVVDPKNVEKSLYIENKKVVQPAKTIRACIRDASANFPFKGMKTYKSLVLGSLEITPEYIVHKNQKWEVDEQVNTGGKKGGTGAQLLARPRLDDWSLEFEIHCGNSAVKAEVLKAILEYAGKFTGIGDRRVDGFGKFKIKTWKVK